MTAAQQKRRLDTLLVDRGLASSRTRARSMILAGQVRLDNGDAAKAGTMLSTAADIPFSKPDPPYVSGGGI